MNKWFENPLGFRVIRVKGYLGGKGSPFSQTCICPDPDGQLPIADCQSYTPFNRIGGSNPLHGRQRLAFQQTVHISHSDTPFKTCIYHFRTLLSIEQVVRTLYLGGKGSPSSKTCTYPDPKSTAPIAVGPRNSSGNYGTILPCHLVSDLHRNRR